MKFRSIITMLFTTGLFSQTQVVMEDVMFIDAPYVGEVTTTTTKYATDGIFRQEVSIDVDRFLIRMAMGGNKKLGSLLNRNTKSRIVYNVKDEEYAMETFDAILGNDGKPMLKSMNSSMNFSNGSKKEVDDEDLKLDDDSNEEAYSRMISESLESISGFDARKVTTEIKSEDGLIQIEEWFTIDTTLFHFVAKVEADLVASYGGQKRNNPRSFSERILKEAEHKFESVTGRMVRYTMEMKDEGNEFKMVWNLKSIREVPFNITDFKILSEYKKVDELN